MELHRKSLSLVGFETRPGIQRAGDLAKLLFDLAEHLKDKYFGRTLASDRILGIPEAINKLFSYDRITANDPVLNRDVVQENLDALINQVTACAENLENIDPDDQPLTTGIERARAMASTIITFLKNLVVNKLSADTKTNSALASTSFLSWDIEKRGEFIYDCMTACRYAPILFLF